MINNISHVIVYTTNMMESVEFYIQKLGFKVVLDSPEFSILNVGGETQVGLHNIKELNLPRIHTEISFGVTDIDKTYSELKEKGITFSRDVIEIGPKSFVANFEDNMGNNLSIYEYKN